MPLFQLHNIKCTAEVLNVIKLFFAHLKSNMKWETEVQSVYETAKLNIKL